MSVQDASAIETPLDLRTRLANWKEVIDTCNYGEIDGTR